jgi:hypothetical protein
MKNATININKILTVINGSLVTDYKMSQFNDVVSQFNEVRIQGFAKPNKLNKYRKQIEECGFALESTVNLSNAGFDDGNSDVMYFVLNYKK